LKFVPLYPSSVYRLEVVDVLVYDLEAVLARELFDNEFLILDGQRLAGPLVLL